MTNLWIMNLNTFPVCSQVKLVSAPWSPSLLSLWESNIQSPAAPPPPPWAYVFPNAPGDHITPHPHASTSTLSMNLDPPSCRYIDHVLYLKAAQNKSSDLFHKSNTFLYYIIFSESTILDRGSQDKADGSQWVVHPNSRLGSEAWWVNFLFNQYKHPVSLVLYNFWQSILVPSATLLWWWWQNGS